MKIINKLAFTFLLFFIPSILCSQNLSNNGIDCGPPVTGIIKIMRAIAYPFSFSNPGQDSSTLACDETAFPVKFYALTSSLAINTQLYINESCVTPVTSPNLWYQNQDNAISYKIDSSGKIIEMYSCSPPTSYEFFFSSPGRTASSLACSQTDFPTRFYAATHLLAMGTQLYTNPDLTSPVGSGDLWYKNAADGNSYRIDNNGQIAEFFICPQQQEEKMYSFKAIHPLGHTGTDYVKFIAINGNTVTYNFTRMADPQQNPCEEIVAREILATVGVTECVAP